MFLAPWFALAGLAIAAGPLLIHLLNRQRFRVVPWAAMDLLREAARRSRRILRLRDLLLLALRTACVLLFALAMARPVSRVSSAVVDPDQPIHAVLVIDNSLSMGYRRLEGSLLDAAKKAARQYVEKLPTGSRVSILPACGSASEFSMTAYGTKEDAFEALDAIELVDRRASAAAAIDLALDACRRTPSPPTKQVVFFSDQQAANWPGEGLGPLLDRLPNPLQVVQVPPDEPENAWIEDFRIQDGVADPGTPAVFLAEVRYEGRRPRYGVQVTLAVEGVTVAARTVELQPGQRREVAFPPYQVDVPVEPGRTAFATAEVSIPHDRLPDDDQRSLIVPVVSALPVVFVDQFGEEEDPARNRFGDTYLLRHLAAPPAAGGAAPPVKVRHVQVESLRRDLLADARLVVIAGVESPGTAVPLLREYVEQGGNLVIAAGGRFDPAAWTQAAWQDGLGILPAPLEAEPVGKLPSIAGAKVEPFQLDFNTMEHRYFLLEQVSREELGDLYRLPFFFKAVRPELGEASLEQAARATVEKAAADRKRLERIDGRLKELAEAELRTALGADRQAERERLEAERREIRPDWLLVESRAAGDDSEARSEEEIRRKVRPGVLAAFDNGVPWMLARDVGRGRVLLLTSGVWREWNTLMRTNTVLVFDRIFRDLLARTLPERNLSTAGRLVLPVAADRRQARFTLVRPDGREEPLAADAVGADRYGLVLANLTERGLYRDVAEGTERTPGAAPGERLEEITLAAGGPAGESELAVLDEAALRRRAPEADFRWVQAGESVEFAGAAVGGDEYWRPLLLAVLALLLVELAVLGWPALRTQRSTAAASSRGAELVGEGRTA